MASAVGAASDTTAVGAASRPALPAATAPSVKWASGELLVKFKNVKLPEDIGPANAIDAVPEAAKNALTQIGGEIVGVTSSIALAHIRFHNAIGVNDAIRILEQSGTVEYAEPNYQVRSTGTASDAKGVATPTAAVNPNDPRFAEQWALNNTGQTGGSADADIDAPEAWDIQTDASAAIVGVLGTGIDYGHVDLMANMWKNPGETNCTDGIDNDGNGYKDDCYGIDAYLNSGDPMDDNGVGTHMAGIVGAVGNNAKGVAGVGWQAKLMALRFLDADGWGWSADAIQCIDYAIKIKTKNSYPRMVLLADLMGGRYSKALYDILATAATNGILVVSGSGDTNDDRDVWPIYLGGYNLPNILNVAASDKNDYRMAFSYGGRSVDLGAPGDSILSTWLTQTYRLATGTAQAASFVAGASALVWSKNPAFDWRRVKGAILNGAEDGLRGAFYYGYNLTEGRLNLANSLQTTAADNPAIFSITPDVTAPQQTITINGINFGTTQGKVTFKGYDFPVASIVSWANDNIVVRVPVTSPVGYDRIKVTNAAGVSRTAFFRLHSSADDEWVYPTYRGTTLLEHEEAAYAQIGNYMWIIGGRSNYGQTTDSVERFSLLTFRGEVRPEWEMPKAVRQAGAAAIGNKIYVVGGYDDAMGKYQSALQIFDTATGTWTRGRNLPQPLGQPSVVSVGTQLWVFGGRSPNNTGLKTSYLYNPAANTWTAKAPIPLKRAYAGTAVPTAGKIWLVSGYTESGGSWYRTKDVIEYSIAANAWEIRDDIPLNGEHSASGVINIGAKVFALYGDGDWGAGEWINPPYNPSWVRNIAWIGGGSGIGTYTPMLGKVGNSVVILSGSRGRTVFQFQSP